MHKADKTLNSAIVTMYFCKLKQEGVFIFGHETDTAFYFT